jgi:hypothetical protein
MGGDLELTLTCLDAFAGPFFAVEDVVFRDFEPEAFTGDSAAVVD